VVLRNYIGQYLSIYIYIIHASPVSLSLINIFIRRKMPYRKPPPSPPPLVQSMFGGDIKIFRGHMRIPRAGIIVILYSRSMYIYYIIIYVSEMLIKKNKIKIITRRIKRNIFSNSSHVFGRRTGSSHRYRYNVIYKYIYIICI
jgi:hypothetical protein